MMMCIIICSTLSSYSWPLKGASILNMLQRVLGEEMMRHGLTLYLEQHKYGNANTDDLWQSLSAASLNSSHPVDVKVSSSKLVNWPMIKLWALIYLIKFLLPIKGDNGQLDKATGLPVGHPTTSRQLDSRFAKAFPTGQFNVCCCKSAAAAAVG